MRIFILMFFTFIMHVHTMAPQIPPASQVPSGQSSGQATDISQLTMPMIPVPGASQQALPDLTAAIPGATGLVAQPSLQAPTNQTAFAFAEQQPVQNQSAQELFQQVTQTQAPATPQPSLVPTAPQFAGQLAATPQQIFAQPVQQFTPAQQIVSPVQQAFTPPVQPAQVQQPAPQAQQVSVPPIQSAQPAQIGQAPQATQPTSPGAIQIPGEPAPKDEAPKEIYLNFENTELASFINYMAEIKNLNIIPDSALEGAKISLTIREPLTVDGAWNIFLTVLEMAGFSIIKIGEVYKIMPKDKKLLQPLPAYINVPASTLPDSDETIRYVFFLTNLQATDIEPLLTSMLSNPHVAIAQKEVNGFIITDKSYNIKAAVKLIQELDQMGLPEDVTVMRLKNANAIDVKATLDALIAKPEGNPLARLLGRQTESTSTYFAPTTRVVAEERTNSLILLGKKDSTQRIIDFITKHIDTSLEAAESPLYIYELQYSDATQVADILTQVTTQPDSTTGQNASKYGAVRGGVKYFKPITFKVDKAGNRLIISCPDKQDWRLLKQTIKDLDKAQPQVAIETLIVVVSVTDTKQLGGATRNKKHGNIGNNVDFQAATSVIADPALQTDTKNGTNPISLLGNMFSQLIPAQGQTLLSFGSDTNVWAVFRALQSQVNASVLSQPFVTVANKTEANVVVGSTIRVVDSVSGDTKGFKDAVANTNIKLVPQINPDGIIGLDITLTIDDFIDTAGTDITNKILKTNVTVADGQVLVLGGFVQTEVQENKTKTPFLGDIPIIGWFFRDQERILTKNYTFVFMSPTIVKPRQTPGVQLYSKLKLHKATDEIEDSVETKQVMDPIHNWFFNPDKENYSHKVIDFANARYQPTTVDIKNDIYYRSQTQREEEVADIKAAIEEKEARERTAAQPRVSSVRDEFHENGKQKEITPAQAPASMGDITSAQTPAQTSAPMGDTTPAQTPAQTPAPMVDTTLVQAPTQTAAPIQSVLTPAQTQAQTSAQNAPAPTLEITDKDLEARRTQLKAMMAQETQVNSQKRENFKDLVATQPGQPSPEEQEMFAEKRNKLKEFLAANPTLATNSMKKLKQVKAHV